MFTSTKPHKKSSNKEGGKFGAQFSPGVFFGFFSKVKNRWTRSYVSLKKGQKWHPANTYKVFFPNVNAFCCENMHECGSFDQTRL